MGIEENRILAIVKTETLLLDPKPVLLRSSGAVDDLLPDFLKDLESRVDTQLDVLRRLISYEWFECSRLWIHRKSLFAPGSEWELWLDEEGLLKEDREVNFVASYLHGDGICGDVFFLPRGLIK